MDEAQLQAFKALVHATGTKTSANPTSKFVKKLNSIPTVELSHADPCRKALLLSETALIGKFTGLWPSPKAVEQWILEHWNHLLKGQVSLFAAGKGYFVFLFLNKEERDLVFRSGPFFMGSRGLFLAPWMLGFNPEDEITAAPVWVKLPHLLLHLWGKSSLEDIGNKLGRFLDSADPKGGQYSCARICVEVNLEKGLPEALNLTLDEWSHIQELDYEKIPFKCNLCHVYGHFAKRCPKLLETQQSSKEAEFKEVTNRRRPPRRKEDPQNKAPGPKVAPPTSAPPLVKTKNRFDALQEDELPEVEAVIETDVAPRRKDANPEVPAAEETPKATKNSFEAPHDLDAQEAEEEEAAPEVEAVTEKDAPEKNEIIPGSSTPSELAAVEPPAKATSPGSSTPGNKKDATTSDEEKWRDHLTSEQDYSFFSTAQRLDASASGRFSPPRTRGRKTNRERRENEAASNCSLGS